MAIAAPAEAQPSAPGELAPQDAQQESGSWREYRVRQGDELWDIAERELGAGERWRQLVAANPGVDIDHPPAPGRVLRDLASTPVPVILVGILKRRHSGI